jgi:hypothetical protein
MDALLQYLHHLNIWIRHSTGADDLLHLLAEREHVPKALE